MLMFVYSWLELACWLTGTWLDGWHGLSSWLTGGMIDWLVRWVGLLAGWLVCLSKSWLADCLAGLLVGLLAHTYFSPSFVKIYSFHQHMLTKGVIDYFSTDDSSTRTLTYLQDRKKMVK